MRRLRGRRGMLLAGGAALLVLGALTAMATLSLGRGAAQGQVTAKGLSDFGDAPAFALTDQLGRPVRSEDLQGKVVVASFIYTNCQDICPLLTYRMQVLQGKLRDAGMLGDKVQLLSVTVDPVRDTPAVLRTYAAQFQADPDAWRFLTGPEQTVVPLVVEGFKLGVTALPPDESESAAHIPGPGASADYQVMHSTRFVLIDRQGRIRAYYDGRDVNLEQVVHDVRRLSP